MMESGGITCAVCGRPVAVNEAGVLEHYLLLMPRNGELPLAVPYRSDHEPRLVEEEAQDADE